MLRVFHSGPWPGVGGEIALEASESTHLVRVRRARIGEPVVVLDGCGGVAEGLLALDDPKAARVRIEKVTRHLVLTPCVLAVGLPKGDGFAEIIRQATELGATELQPLLTMRTEVRLDETRAEKKLERWRAAALDACKQSGNPWLPQIHAPLGLKKWLENLPKNADKRRLVAALTPDAVFLPRFETRNPKLETVLAVGPEGDFTPEEYALLKKNGFVAVRLPGHILRVETACAAALTLIAD